MTYFKNKLFILAVILAVLLIIIFVSLSTSKKAPVAPSLPSPTPTLKIGEKLPEKPTPTLLPVEFTGEKEEELPADEVSQINSAFELRNKLPIETSEFKLEYDYKQAKFIVTINQPYGQNQFVFNKWLSDNGYLQIPKEKFIYK